MDQPAPPDPNQVMLKVTQELVDVLPERLKQFVLFASIPNSFTPELLQQMLGGEYDAAGTLEALQPYHFLIKGEENWYSLSPEMRQVLSATWQPGQQAEFQRANAAALRYFQELSARPALRSRYVYHLEAAYHLLLGDEQKGLETFADVFEQFMDQHQIGPGQDLLCRLNQALPRLSPLAGQHAAYYQARLDFLLNKPREDLRAKLVDLRERTADDLLKARVGILIGEVFADRYEWRNAVTTLRLNLAALRRLKADRYAARAMLSFGSLYLKLVAYSGGLRPPHREQRGALNRVLSFALFFPYILLSWLRSTLPFFPSLLYFNGSYQDWIFNYLLRKAGGWYRRAWRLARKTGDDVVVLDALFGQAVVAVQQHREAKARQMYARLARLPEVQSSRYRQAQVMEGLGKVFQQASSRRSAVTAAEQLSQALEVYRDFEDDASIAPVSRSLAQTYLRLGKTEAGAEMLLESFSAYQRIRDPLSQTQVYWEMDELQEYTNFPAYMVIKIRDTLAAVPERQYITCFPEIMLGRFRNLLSVVALPISYLLILVMGAVVCLAITAIEAVSLQVYDRLSLIEISSIIIVSVLPIPFTFWTIELIYMILGQAWVLLLGRKSLELLSEQPNRVTTTPEALEIEEEGPDRSMRLKWAEVEKLVSADFKVWRRPLFLMSSQYLKGSSRQDVVTVEGITSGYLNLEKDLRTRIRGGLSSPRNPGADITLIANRWIYLTIALCIVQSIVLFLLGQGNIKVFNAHTCEQKGLIFSIFPVFMILNSMVLLPPAVLLQVCWRRWVVSRLKSVRLLNRNNVLLFGVTLLLTLFAALWLVTTPTLKIGGPPKAPPCVPAEHGRTLYANRGT